MTPWQAGSFSCLIPPVFHLHYSKQPQEARTVPDCIAYWDIESSLTAKQPLKPTFDPFRKQPPGFSASHTVRELVMSESPAEMSDGPCERMIVLDEVSNTLAASVPRPDLKTFLHTILKSQDYSDLKISLKNGKEYLVHKAIVSQSCSTFQDLLVQEAEVNRITGLDKQSGGNRIDEIRLDAPPNACYALIEYLYTRDYDFDSVEDNQIQVFFHLDVFLVAMEYKVDGLKHLAELRFNKALRSEHPDGWSICDLVTKVYDTPSEPEYEGLKVAVSMYCAAHMPVLFSDQQFRSQLSAVPEFGNDFGEATTNIDGNVLNCACDWNPN
ncbi:hypothetical protein IWZ00DRAFT_548126 [Phyllosticta capitalensis]